MLFERTKIIPGEVSYTNIAQILNSKYLRELIIELINDAEESHSSFQSFFQLFLKNPDKTDISEKYDIEQIVQLLLAISANTLESLDASSYFSFPKLVPYRQILTLFIENTFNLWRSKHRFMIKKDPFSDNPKTRIHKQITLVKNNYDLKSLVLETYRQILINVSDKRTKILRQLPSGAQANFILDKIDFEPQAKIKNADFLYNMYFVWSIILEPPVIFYTRSNKRSGLFKVVDKPILHKIDIKNTDEWLVFPIYVHTKLIYVLVHKEYFALAAGLANLFEFANFGTLNSDKPDGIYIFGIDKNFFENEKDFNGIIYKEDDGTYVALVGNDPSVDYFGYMKKMILTIHNLLVIDEGRLPIHGALAEVKLRDKTSYNIMLVGDSGAGKSETLEALTRIKEQVSEVNIIIDDMGSLDILENGTVVAYGTETGAFVRLDDLQPGYAYSTMDRSIFMNPHETNARVIVPYSNYDEIIKPTKIDFFFYANNYEPVDENHEVIEFFDTTDKALEVFSHGTRMAKGTTSEKGLTHSYFANPFGAEQRKAKHEQIAKKYMETMMESGVKVGTLRTQLGINGFEEDGPMLAAKTLLTFLKTNNQNQNNIEQSEKNAQLTKK
jgi:hypothetical protein